VLAVCGSLLLAVGLVFSQTVHYEFVNFDDNVYVYENPHVSRGLSSPGIAWVFTHEHGANWHPLTGLSHLLDCQVFGLNAGAHHLTNVLLHAATAILLFLFLWRMTGGLWPSALVAAIFAVHPLRVESVAWVSERKDVLSGLCFVLTLGAYVGYVGHRFSVVRYVAVIVSFALGLMAKPMLVTLPLVLLLLDYWPFGRMTSADAPVVGDGWSGDFSFPVGLLLEKVPLLLLAAASCAVTVWAQGEAVLSRELLPLGSRIANALVSYVAYLGQSFYPFGLAAFYPHPRLNLPVWKIVGALLVLACISAGTLACWRRYPYLLVGWLWYLGMLVPVIGLVQVGAQAMADRYTHLTQIGLCIAVVWGVADLTRSWSYRGWVRGVSSALVLAVLMGCAWRQTMFWRDSETLWTHALACTSQNYVAYNELGLVLTGRGRIDEAMAYYQKALEISPDYAETHNNLGVALADRGQVDSAIIHYQKALDISPNYAEARNNLAVALAGRGQVDSAFTHYEKVLEIKPDYAEAHNNLGNALAGRGQIDSAIAHYQKALESKPDYAEARNNLGNALTSRGQVDSAIAQYQEALVIKPDYAEAHNNLGRALSEKGRFDEATAHFQRAVRLKPDDAEAHINLGLVLQARGRFDEAIAQLQQALQINPNHGEAHNNLAWLRATCPAAALRNGAEAIAHAQRAKQLLGNVPGVLDTLAAAYAEAGRFPEALATARKALELTRQQNNQAVANALLARIALYEAGKPYCQEISASAPLLLPKP
jgi:tetratricopeptide (TPR) repeat protein